MVSPPPKSCEVMQCRFRLLQVEGHVHLAVHRHGLGEMLTRLLPLAGSKIESTEAEMTVGDQRAHTAVRRNHERLAIVVLTLSTIGSFGMSRDVSKQVMRSARQDSPPHSLGRPPHHFTASKRDSFCPRGDKEDQH